MEKTMEKNQESEPVPVEHSVSEQAKNLHVSGLSYDDIAKRLNVSKSKAWRMINKNQANMTQEQSIEAEGNIETQQVPIQKHGETKQISKTVPNETSETFESDLTLAGLPVELLTDVELKSEIMREKREHELLRLRARNEQFKVMIENPGKYHQGRDGQNQNASSDPAKVFVDATKSVVEAIKLGVSVGSSANSGGGGFNAKDMLEFGDKREDKILAMQNNANNLAKTSVEANLYSVKVKEMELEDKQDDRKIEWEKEKFHEEKESTKQIYGLIIKGLDIVKPAVETGLRWAGTMAKNKIEKLETTTITCPSCSKDFPVIKNSPYVICPFCKAQMQLQPPPEQAPPQPNPIPGTPQPQPSEEQPQPQNQPNQEPKQETNVSNASEVI
jgi:hypothetical protein